MLNKVIIMGGDVASAFNGPQDPEELQPVLTGGPPPSLPSSSVRIAIQDRSDTPLTIEDGETTPSRPIEVKKPKPVIKKPKIVAPPWRQPIIIVDPPIRRRPQKNRELLEILDGFGGASRFLRSGPGRTLPSWPSHNRITDCEPFLRSRR
jgi:hypothetical protein